MIKISLLYYDKVVATNIINGNDKEKKTSFHIVSIERHAFEKLFVIEMEYKFVLDPERSYTTEYKLEVNTFVTADPMN